MVRLLTSLLLLVFVSCSPVKKYKDLPEVKSWETDIRNFEKLDSLQTYPENAILFTGSSSIRLWSTLAEDMSPYPVIQRGYGGAKLSDFATYADRIIYPHQTRAIVMFIANDITGSTTDKTPEEVHKLFSYVLKTIRKKYPDTPFFWIAVTPTSSRWSVWPQITEAGRLIQEECEKNSNTYYIKTDYAYLNANGEPKYELFLPDKLHLTPEGYVIWNRIIKDELRKVIGE